MRSSGGPWESAGAATRSNITRCRSRLTNLRARYMTPPPAVATGLLNRDRGFQIPNFRMQRLSKSRLTMLAIIALLPSFLKRSCYRLFFGYQIGKRVRVVLSIIDAQECRIDDDVKIGHLNLVVRVKKLQIEDHVRIGHLNIIRGGDEVHLGRYSEIIRMNEIN